MKRVIALLLILFLLCGCSSAGSPTPAAETTQAEKWTEDRLLEVFQQHAREGSEVIDCVLMEKSDYGIAGVVQYTLTGDNVCRFDVIRNDGTLNRIGMEFLTDGEETLAIAGPDSFSFRAIEADDSVYTLTISYYEDAQTGENGFRISEKNELLPEQNAAQPEPPQPEETFFRESSADHNDPRWTEQELLTAFYQYAELGTVVVDCVVLEESACDIAGVVQYTLPEEKGCWFDFIKSHGIPHSTGSEAMPAGEDTLVCVDVDTVQCRLVDKNGEEFVCEVTYFEDPDNNTTGFKLVSR